MNVERLYYYPIALDQISDKSCALCFEDPKKNEEWVAHEINGNSHPLHRECAEKVLKDRITCITCESPLHALINHDKWKLALRIVGQNTISLEALEAIFDGAIQCLEKFANTIFDDSMKERVWKVVSKNRLESLQNTFIHEFCLQILGSFNAEDSAVMLEEHSRTGAVCDLEYCIGLQMGFQLHQKSVTDAVIIKANSMTDDLVAELVDALAKESIVFPKRKAQSRHDTDLIISKK